MKFSLNTDKSGKTADFNKACSSNSNSSAAGAQVLPARNIRKNAKERRRPHRRPRRYSPAMRATAAIALTAFVYAFILPSGTLAQEFKSFEERSKSDLDRYDARADRMEEVNAWNNYMELGVATERIEWESEALDTLSNAVDNIEESDQTKEEKQSEIESARSQFEAARDAWLGDANEYLDSERGIFKAEQAIEDEGVRAVEVAAEQYEEMIAAVEAEVYAQLDADLGTWEAAMNPRHAALTALFEDELAGRLADARTAGGSGLS